MDLFTLRSVVFSSLRGKTFNELLLYHPRTYVHQIILHLNSIFFDRIIWLICVCVAIYGCTSLAERTWQRFQYSPMVISMDRNKFVWNTTFPSLTVCPNAKIDDNKLEMYMKYVFIFFEFQIDKFSK